MVHDPLRSSLGYGLTGSLTEVIVCFLSDLPEPVAGVITLLPATEYRICDLIDLGTARIVCGLNTVIHGSHGAISGLRTNNAAALLTTTVALQVDEISLMNTGGPAVNLQAVDGHIALAEVEITGSVSAGTISNCERITLNGVSVEGCADGFTFDGTIRDIFVLNITCEGNTGTFASLRFPATLTAGSVTVSVGVMETDVGQTGMVVADAATIGNFSVVELHCETPAGALGTFSDPVIAIFKAQPRVRLSTNAGQPDSVVRGGIAFTGNTTEDTVIAVQGTFVAIGNGNASHPVFVLDAGSERASLQNDAAVDQTLRYDGLEVFNANVIISLTIEPASGGAIQFAGRLMLGGVLVANSVFQSTSNTGGQPGSLSFNVPLEIENLEELQIEVANETSTADLTVLAARLTIT